MQSCKYSLMHLQHSVFLFIITYALFVPRMYTRIIAIYIHEQKLLFFIYPEIPPCMSELRMHYFILTCTRVQLKIQPYSGTKNVVFDPCGDSEMYERGTAVSYRCWSTAVPMRPTSHQLVTAEELKRFRYQKNGAADTIFVQQTGTWMARLTQNHTVTLNKFCRSSLLRQSHIKNAPVTTHDVFATSIIEAVLKY